MALTSCPDCGGKVSTVAKSCPHCGRPCQDDPKQSVIRELFRKYHLLLTVVSATAALITVAYLAVILFSVDSDIVSLDNHQKAAIEPEADGISGTEFQKPRNVAVAEQTTPGALERFEQEHPPRRTDKGCADMVYCFDDCLDIDAMDERQRCVQRCTAGSGLESYGRFTALIMCLSEHGCLGLSGMTLQYCTDKCKSWLKMCAED